MEELFTLEDNGKWIYNNLYIPIPGEKKISIPIFHFSKLKIKKIFPWLVFPSNIHFFKVGHFLIYSFPLSFIEDNEVFRDKLIISMDLYRNKEAYTKDDVCGDLVCELSNRRLWMKLERLMAFLEKREIEMPREVYTIYHETFTF